MKIGTKIIFAALAAVAVTVAVTLVVQKFVIERQGIDLTVGTMRAAVLEAENVRESISRLGQRGAFDRKKLFAEFQASGDLRNSTVYETIPVVAAWEAIAKVAQQEGFEFRVPKNHARNPKNAPTPDELEILKVLEPGAHAEYVRVDRASNRIIFARPIKLTQDCLSCHGDPATSPTHDGKDAVGFTMENWKAGEVHGAFVLKADLSRVDGVVLGGMLRSLAWVLPLTAGIGVGFYFFNRRMIVRPLHQSIAGLKTASASAELNAQTESLDRAVAALVTLVGGAGGPHTTDVAPPPFGAKAPAADGGQDTDRGPVPIAPTRLSAISTPVRSSAWRAGALPGGTTSKLPRQSAAR